MYLARLILVLACSATVWGCSKTPDSGSGNGGGGDGTVDRSSRIGWDQEAADVAQLTSLRYVIYVDGSRTELTGASCSSTSSAAGYPCSAGLPVMSAGQHRLELASYIIADGSTVESAKSSPLTVTVSATGILTSVTTSQAVPRASASASVPAPSARSRELTTSDGVRLVVKAVDTVETASALAVADDGTVFIGYGPGRLRVVRNQQVVADEALSAGSDENGSAAILDLALDPGFSQNHLIYALEVNREESATFRLSRFREAAGRLGERAVLLDGVPAARSGTAASLAFGTDGLLYLALDAGDDPGDAQRAASYNGKVLRLTAEGTVPADEPSASPVYGSNFIAPSGLAWDARSSSLWVADAGNGQVRRLRRVAGRRPGQTAYAFPATEQPASVAIYQGALIPSLRGSLLVALAGGRDYLLRARLTSDETRLARTERLTIATGAQVRLVEVAADGAIYVATDREVLRLTPRQ